MFCLLYSLFSISVMAERMQTKGEHQNGIVGPLRQQRGSSNGDYIQLVPHGPSFVVVGIAVFSKSVGCHPLFSHVSSLARARSIRSLGLCAVGSNMSHLPQIGRNGPVRQCTIGTSSLSMRWWILEGVHSHLLPSPCQPKLVSDCQVPYVTVRGSLRHGNVEMVEEQLTGCVAWQPTG
jgi:hypothetical protein